MKIVAISDIHGKWNKIEIPECDILISAGDYSFRGEKHMVKDFHAWLNKQDANHIISVQGNHELWVESNFEEAKEIANNECPGVHFIGDGEAVNIEGLNIYGSAITPFFCDWAWNRARGSEPDTMYYRNKTKLVLPIKPYWDKIPENTDILVSHGPPLNFLDTVYNFDGVTPKDRVGCADLRDKVLFGLPNLKHHIFGHIHSGYGHAEFMGKHFWNVSICDEQYQPTNPITIIEI